MKETPKHENYSEDLLRAEEAKEKAAEMERMIEQIEDDLLYFTQHKEQLLEAIELGEPAFTEKDVENAEEFIAETKKTLEMSEHTKQQYKELEALCRETHEKRRQILERFKAKGEPN